MSLKCGVTVLLVSLRAPFRARPAAAHGRAVGTREFIRGARKVQVLTAIPQLSHYLGVG
jgi:hypothetical protein